MKPKRTIEGNATANARIKIDYSGKVPAVRFSYPDLKNQYQGSMYYWIFTFWILFLGLMLVGYSLGSDFLIVTNAMKNPQTVNTFNQCVQHYTNNFNYVVATTCYNESQIEFYYKYNLNLGSGHQITTTNYVDRRVATPWDVLLMTSIWLWVMFGIPWLIYFPFRKFWDGKIYPKWNAKFSRKIYVSVKAKDLKKDVDGKYTFEVPLFHNVRLRYKVTEGFSKELTMFEIHEHPFNITVSRSLREIFRDRRKAKKLQKKYKVKLKKTIDDHYWFARFTFKRKPESGFLEVVFR